MKKLKFLLFILPFFAFSNVFADNTYDMTSRITSPVNFSECGTGSYTGVELNGATNCWNTNTRNQGTLSRIYFNLPSPTGSEFETDTAYRLSLYMATNDWRNRFGTVAVRPGSSYTNNFVDTFTFVSMKQVNITFTVPYGGSTTYQTLFVDLPATNTTTLITGDSNWNLSKVTLTKLTSGSGGGSTTPSGPSTTWDDTGIINNNNENTQNVINNNNQNTSDIIDNNNQNTSDIVDNNNKNTQNVIDNQNALLGNCKKNLINLSDVNTSDISSGYRYRVPLVAGKVYTLKSYDNVFNFKIGSSRYSYTDNEGDTSSSLYTFTYTPNSNNTEHYLMVYYPDPPGSNLSTHQLVLVEGIYNGSFINYNEQLCSSKLDDINSGIAGAIANSNQNKQDIINNQNENTNKEINSQKVCRYIDKNNIIIDKSYLLYDGQTRFNRDFGITDYIDIVGSDVEILTTRPGGASLCFYNTNKSLISCITGDHLRLGHLDIPTSTQYIRVSISKTENKPTLNICKNGNQAMNDTLTDSNIDNGVGEGFFDDFTSQDFGLSQIISIPLNTIQSLTSKSCVPLQIPIPFTNSNVTLPCMTEIYETKFSTIYNLWKIVSFGIVAYLIAIDIFHIVKGFKDPESDKVEVLDL